MDPASALFLILTLRPVHADHHAVMLPGAFLPVILPLDGLPEVDRNTWLLTDGKAPVERRVESALAIGDQAQAWRLVTALGQPITGKLVTPLAKWSATELTRLHLTNSEDPVLVVGGADGGVLRREAEAALRDTMAVLPSLPWPRWVGPLLVVGPDASIDPAPGRTRLARPALPVLRVADADRGRLAAAMSDLALDLTAPPARGWPAWLRTGMREMALMRARNQGPGPLSMQERRQKAGVAAIRNLFNSDDPDANLACALCAPLLTPGRNSFFTSLLDWLRNDVSPEHAVQKAYGWTLEALINAR